MALANFFDKAALAASHVLSGFDADSFAGILGGNPVGVFYGGDAASAREGRTTVEMVVNILARLCPSLAIGSSGSRDGFSDRLAAMAREINPEIQLDVDPGSVKSAVAVGHAVVPPGVSAIYAGSDGWVSSVSSRRPLGCGDSGNPFGASVAGCIATANVFRAMFSGQLPRGQFDDEWSLSLLDFVPRDLGAVDPGFNPDWRALDIGEVHLVGIGAVGSGAVWSLARAMETTGTLHLIDPERYDLTNLQRYVLATQADVGDLKVARAAREIEVGGSLHAIGHACTWEDYLKERGDWHLDHVAVALDSGEDRCAVQAALPRRIVNAWTQTGDLGVSRHAFVEDEACLMCLYLPGGKRKGRHELIAESLGMPEAAKDVAQLLYGNQPLGPEWIARIAAATGIPAEQLAPFELQTIDDFHAKAVCGGVILSLGGSARPTGRTEVPMAFQSALAGVLLSAEIVISAGGLRSEPLPVTTKIDVLRPLGKFLSFPERKHPSGRCICQDVDYVTAYRRKYFPDATMAASAYTAQGKQQ